MPLTGKVCTANSLSTRPEEAFSTCTLPLAAPTARSGAYSDMFFMVSGGHMRTTKGGAASPDRRPLVKRRRGGEGEGEEKEGKEKEDGGRRSSRQVRGSRGFFFFFFPPFFPSSSSTSSASRSTKMTLPSLTTTHAFLSVIGSTAIPSTLPLLPRRTPSL